MEPIVEAILNVLTIIALIAAVAFIIILLVAGNIAGLLGMILGVPLYAVTKVVVKFVYDIAQIRTTPEKEQSKE